MQPICVSGSRTDRTLGSGESSQKWCTRKSGSMFIKVGGTFSSQTAALEFSSTGAAGTWATFAVDMDGTGTPVDQTWDGSGDVNPRRYIVDDMFFRVTVSSGGSPAITVEVSGDHVHIFEDS